MKEVVIYTDGACSGNPGPGGWGTVLLYGETRKELNGAEVLTTNQRMELKAAVMALAALKMPCAVTLYSDSAYLINAFVQNWFAKWEVNGWLNSKKQPVENADLWRELRSLAKEHRVTWVKVKGHAGVPENERCDQLARAAIAGLRASSAT
ncbi:MAG: ribonuclease HI [Firmicutes bacterium]|nr:ribonuclease HI [Dethiobacter sp.]MBS3889612.1 ribonuclease HI [Bacillota bacterium]MBS4054099.1 ribonuclease HI [Thermaerobacter sp.]